MTTVQPPRGRPFDSHTGRLAGLISGRVRRAAAAERAWSEFVSALLVADEFDRLAGRLARKFDRLAG